MRPDFIFLLLFPSLVFVSPSIMADCAYMCPVCCARLLMPFEFA